MATSISQYTPVFLPGEPPTWQRSLTGHRIQGIRVRHNRSDPVRIDARYFCLWHLCHSGNWVWRWHSCLAFRDPGSNKYAGTQTASAAGVLALSESFFGPLVAGYQKFSLASLSLWLCPFRHLEGFLYRHSVVRGISHLKEHPGWGPTLQFSVSGIWWASLSVVQLRMLACGERVAMVVVPPPTHDSAVSSCFHGCLAFLHKHSLQQSPPSQPLNLSLLIQQ